MAKRELYTDSDETIIHVCRPMILNGIEDVVTRQDLLDRSIYLNMPRIPDGRRRPEAVLVKHFEQIHPKILGGITRRGSNRFAAGGHHRGRCAAQNGRLCQVGCCCVGR